MTADGGPKDSPFWSLFAPSYSYVISIVSANLNALRTGGLTKRPFTS